MTGREIKGWQSSIIDTCCNILHIHTSNCLKWGCCTKQFIMLFYTSHQFHMADQPVRKSRRIAHRWATSSRQGRSRSRSPGDSTSSWRGQDRSRSPTDRQAGRRSHLANPIPTTSQQDGSAHPGNISSGAGPHGMVSDIVSAVTAGVQAALAPLLQSLGQRQDLMFKQSTVAANPSGVTGQSLGQQANRGEGHSCQDPQPPSGGLPMVGGGGGGTGPNLAVGAVGCTAAVGEEVGGTTGANNGGVGFTDSGVANSPRWVPGLGSPSPGPSGQLEITSELNMLNTSLISGIPDSVRIRIWEFRYIDLTVLIHRQDTSFGVGFETGEVGREMVSRHKQSRAVQILEEWDKAFARFHAIMIERHPQLSEALIAHQQQVKKVAANRGDWMAYDEAFRHGVADGSIKWGQMNAGLLMDAMSFSRPGPAPNRGQAPQRNKGPKTSQHHVPPLASVFRSIRVGIAHVVVAPGTTHVRSATGATPWKTVAIGMDLHLGKAPRARTFLTIRGRGKKAGSDR